MTIENNFLSEAYSSQRGSGAIMALIILVIVALVGAMAFMSGKIKVPNKKDNVVQSVSVDTPEIDVNANPVLAKVLGDEITRQDVLDLVNIMPAQMRQIPLEQLFPMALEQLINNKIIDDKANRSGLENNEAVKKQLQQAKQQIIRAKYLEDAIKIEMTEERLQVEYNKYIASFVAVEEVKASHILVDNEKLAKSIIAKLNKGSNFADLAKENSKDDSGANGGDLGYFTEKEVVSEFAKAAFSTKVGEYTKSPVKSEFGYHIIKVEEKRNRPAAEFDQAKPYLEKELQRSVLDGIIKGWIATTEVERFDINGKPLPTQPSTSSVIDISENLSSPEADLEVAPLPAE